MKKKYVICKVCGYILEEKELHDICPACGVLAKAFEPYKPKINFKRERILSLHLHPIILHFPQAVVVFSLLLIMLIPFFKGEWKDYITICAKFNTFLLPLCILGGFCSGLIDGKIRFKTVKRPILIKKIILSCIFLVLSIAAALILLLAPLNLTINILIIVLLLAATMIAVIMGKIGSRLVAPIFPG